MSVNDYRCPVLSDLCSQRGLMVMMLEAVESPCYARRCIRLALFPLDTQGQGTTVVHHLDCPGVGTAGATACRPGAACPTRYAAESLRVSFVSKLKMAFHHEPGRSAALAPG